MISMNTELPPPPPPPANPSVDSVEGTGRLSHPFALFAVAAVIGLMTGLVVGFGVGWLVALTANADCSPHDGWCDLGGLFAGLLIGAATGLVAYVGAGAITIARCRPTGRTRILHILAHLAVIPGLPILLITLANVLP